MRMAATACSMNITTFACWSGRQGWLLGSLVAGLHKPQHKYPCIAATDTPCVLAAGAAR
jgi:hypothetical protein